MQKKLFALVTALLLITALALPVFASEEPPADTASAPATTTVTHIRDAEALLSKKAKKEVEKAAEDVYQTNGVELFGYLTGETTENAAAIGEELYSTEARTDAAVLLVADAEGLSLYVYGRANRMLTPDDKNRVLEDARTKETARGICLQFIKTTAGILEEKGVSPIPTERLHPRLVDNAGLIAADEEEELCKKLDKISENREIDVVIVTENSIGNKSSSAYADDYYDYNGYGFHDSRDGILLLISMENRDWAISTTGLAIDIFTDAGQSYMTDQFVSYLSDGDFAGGFDCFADLCDEFIDHYETEGEAYDTDHLPKSPFGAGTALLIALAAGAAVGLTTVMVFRSQLRSVRVQEAAVNYIVKDSLQFTDKSEVFLYHVVNRTRKPEPSSSSSGSSHSGGSSGHYSSSGSHHGGSSGHF